MGLWITQTFFRWRPLIEDELRLIYEVHVKGEDRPSKADFPCGGYRISTPDGDDFDCEYEFAGEITCDECLINGQDYDPRIGRSEEREEKELKELLKMY